MTPSSFVTALEVHCRDQAVADCMETLVKPPGRRPAAELLALSRWFIGLPEEDKENVRRAVRLAASDTLFGVLCVLDGVRVIEDGEKSEFYLKAVRGGLEERLLPSEEDLHDLYRSEV